MREPVISVSLESDEITASEVLSRTVNQGNGRRWGTRATEQTRGFIAEIGFLKWGALETNITFALLPCYVGPGKTRPGGRPPSNVRIWIKDAPIDLDFYAPSNGVFGDANFPAWRVKGGYLDDYVIYATVNRNLVEFWGAASRERIIEAARGRKPKPGIGGVFRDYVTIPRNVFSADQLRWLLDNADTYEAPA